MPSYVIHHIAGNKLIENYKLSDSDKQLFLMGNLISDSSKVFGNITDVEEKRRIKEECYNEIQNEKIKTHFRNETDKDKIVMLPQPEYFKEKYKDLLTDITVLGYYFHLYTDRYFLENFFNETFMFLDENYKKTDILKKVKYMEILKDGKIINSKYFWSPKGIYDDYTKINKLVLDHYNISFDEEIFIMAAQEFVNPGIEEVDYQNIESVIIDMLSYIDDANKISDVSLQIFDENKIFEFINEVTKNFEEKNKTLLKSLRR